VDLVEHARTGEEGAQDVREKVAMSSDRFQTRNIPRRCWIITECR
jgi:hypothetical protein